LWPQTHGFRDTAIGYFNALWRLGLDLHQAIAADLALPPNFFADRFDRPMATLRLLHYPAREALERSLSGAGEHTDYGSIKILLTDDAGGLEVRRRDGAWITAPPIPDAFICNIGDCLMRWSNDTYVSTPHRVTSPPAAIAIPSRSFSIPVRTRWSNACRTAPRRDSSQNMPPSSRRIICGSDSSPPMAPVKIALQAKHCRMYR
jgi:isopenicillin N synthase-like dioxygenase